MPEPAQPEPLISTNALLFFLLPMLGMMLVTSGSISQYFSGGGLLAFSLLSAVGPLVYIIIGQRASAQTDRRRFWWTLAVCTMLVVGLTARQSVIRSGSDVAGIHDGAVQAEVAAAKLLRGENPYGGDYRYTPYQLLNPPIEGGPAINVVWSHFIYPPLIFLLYAPLAFVRSLIGPLADYRVIAVGALGGVAALLILAAKTWSQRTTATLLTLGNPLLWIYAVIGANDIISALCLLAATLLMVRKKWWWSGVIFGLALTAKQSAWPLLPLWLFWLWRSARASSTPATARHRGILGTITSAAVIFGPFLLWQPWRIIDDLIRYASGSIPYSYPISGTTFLQYLNVFRLVDSPWAIIPTYLFQLAIGLPALFFVWRWIRQNASPARWLAGAGVLTMSVLLFSRYFNNNYFVVSAVLFIAAYILTDREIENGP